MWDKSYCHNFLHNFWKISIAIKRTEWLSVFEWFFDELASHESWVRFLFFFLFFMLVGIQLSVGSHASSIVHYWPLCNTCKWNWKQKKKTKLNQYVSDNLEQNTKRPTGLKGHLIIRDSALRSSRLSTTHLKEYR